MNTKTTIVIITSILFALTAFNSFNKQTITSNPEVDIPYIKGIFTKWAQKHGKNYASSNERTFRLKVFIKNYIAIMKSNASQKNYRMGLNQFSDMTSEEFEAKYLGYVPTTQKYEFAQVTQEDIADTPEAIDWRTKGIVAPVKNQGQCGSCWAFSAVAAIEGAMAQSTGTLQTFAEQQLVDCSVLYGNHGCNGGLMDNAFRYVHAKGLTTEANYPYHAREGRCNHDAVHKKVAHVSKHKDVTHNNSEHLKVAVGDRVVSVAIQANDIMHYTSGIFDNKFCGTQLNHGVSVVGYGSEGGKDFWIVRNSWGATWGEQGYIRMIRTDKHGAGICGIAMKASYPIA